MEKDVVLSVDDDEGLQVVLTQYLEGEGYAVTTARNGAEMETKIESEDANIILLDLGLPDTDGVSLIPFIRSNTKVPIIVVSGKNDTTEKVICLEMGADDYLTKPFELRELKARIKASLRRYNESKKVKQEAANSEDTKEKIIFGRFTLDREQYQVFENGADSLDMTIGEFQLLETLVTAPNRTLSRQQLFELTREGEYDAYDRAIDIQIGRIRKKLGEDGAELIRTMRGVGYMFCPPD